MSILLAEIIFFKSGIQSGNIALVRTRHLVRMEQVHGNKVVRVGKKDEGRIIKNCDALITNEKDLELCVRVADCLPISVVDKKGRAIGLIHAGWRGLHKKIISKTIKKMVKEFSVDPRYLEVKIGPHICRKHYEVGKEVADKFDGQRFLDLGEVARQQLVDLGIKNQSITIDQTCTFESKNLFSYRRDHTDKRNLYFLHLVGGEGDILIINALPEKNPIGYR